MSKSQQSSDDSSAVPVVNGVALTGLDAVEDAFSYMTEDYNDAALWVGVDGEEITITSRKNIMEHWRSLRDADALRVTSVSCTHDGRSKVTLRER